MVVVLVCLAQGYGCLRAQCVTGMSEGSSEDIFVSLSKRRNIDESKGVLGRKVPPVRYLAPVGFFVAGCNRNAKSVCCELFIAGSKPDGDSEVEKRAACVCEW